MKLRVLLIAAVALTLTPACNRHSGFELTNDDCVTCHRTDYDTAINPPHDNMPTECALCHLTSAWRPASFSHPFRLTGAHLSVPCSGCHVGNPPVYAGTPNECVGCHLADYQSSPYPGHSSFPTTCNDCHSTAAWRPATTSAHPFPLDGAHALTPCESCHVGDPPVYLGTPNTCVGCHLADYQSSPYPGHSNFPTTCEECHTTTAWTPATGGSHPESAFPITTGVHAGITCINCHNPNLGAYANGANTDCVGCHTGEHSRARMDNVDPHINRRGNGYPTGAAPPNFCLDCHPAGRR